MVGCYRWKESFFGWSFRRSGCETTSPAFVYFYARVLMVYEYSSSGQAIFYKSIARVKGNVPEFSSE